MDKFQRFCYWVCVIVCVESLIRVGYSPFPILIITLMGIVLILDYTERRNKRLETEGYTGENDSFIEINKRIVITRDGDADPTPYLIRRSLLTIGKFISFKYHQILQSDDVCPHDHPWAFITIILKGGYYEWTPVTQSESGKILHNRVGVDGNIEVQRWHGAGSIMYRPAKWRHRLELNTTVETKDSSVQLVPAHTFVITLPVVRDWGFFTKTGWIFWKDYNKKRDC
jgi:hypothetical protein